MKKFSVKHWRATNCCYIIAGCGLGAISILIGKPYGMLTIVIGAILITTGIIANKYDTAIEKAGCIEKVAREM